MLGPARTIIAEKPMIIRSPDGKLLVTARYSEPNGYSDVKLTVTGSAKGVIDLGPGVDSEFLWRPDSRAFLVTTSDGGATGPYRTIFTSLTPQDSIDSWDMTQLIYRAFGRPVRCYTSEDPNVGGVAFLANGHFLIAAEVVPHANCDSMGTFVLYEVDPHLHVIVKKYSQLEAKRLFYKDLGQELREADDNCVRHPRSCYVTTNHPELQPHDSKPR
jgi:hypothetical protein